MTTITTISNRSAESKYTLFGLTVSAMCTANVGGPAMGCAGQRQRMRVWYRGWSDDHMHDVVGQDADLPPSTIDVMVHHRYAEEVDDATATLGAGHVATAQDDVLMLQCPH